MYISKMHNQMRTRGKAAKVKKKRRGGRKELQEELRRPERDGRRTSISRFSTQPIIKEMSSRDWLLGYKIGVLK